MTKEQFVKERTLYGITDVVIGLLMLILANIFNLSMIFGILLIGMGLMILIILTFSYKKDKRIEKIVSHAEKTGRVNSKDGMLVRDINDLVQASILLYVRMEIANFTVTLKGEV